VSADLTRPPIPASCSHRPVIGGLVAPIVNVRLADGGVDFRSPHHETYARCWTDGLCQVCGNRLSRPAILFGGPNQLRSGHFDEPPLCPPCALYASQACPMVAGRQPYYADRQRVSEGHRGKVCADPGCGCGGWTPTDPGQGDHGGDPAHPWYAVYIDPAAVVVTVHEIETVCSDKGCKHKRRVVNGGKLTAPPLKVLLVSEPGVGRVWRRLSPQETAEVTR
jgi:hypothetical protein